MQFVDTNLTDKNPVDACHISAVHVLDRAVLSHLWVPYFLIQCPTLNSFRSKISVYKVENWNIAATFWIGYNFQIQKRIASTETIWGSKVTKKCVDLVKVILLGYYFGFI